LDVRYDSLDLRLANVGFQDKDGLVLSLRRPKTSLRPHHCRFYICVQNFGSSLWTLGPREIRDQGERGEYPLAVRVQADLV
jgi:hypothetical protein